MGVCSIPRFATIAAVLALAAGPAAARPFMLLKAGPDAWTLVDPRGIELPPGKPYMRRAFTVTVQKSILDGADPQPGYVRTQNEYDCGANRYRWLKLSVFTRSGAEVLAQENTNQLWIPATKPEVAAELRAVCGLQANPSVISADNVGAAVIALMSAWDPPPPPKPGPNAPGAKATAMPAKGPSPKAAPAKAGVAKKN